MKMKNLAIICLGVSFCALSCRKAEDVLAKEAQATVNNTTANSWNKLGGWHTEKTSGSVIEYTTIADAKISSSIFSSGLVLVYKKNESGVQTFPAEETGTNGNVYWSYQVSEGNIIISREGVQALTSTDANSFLYIILTADQLSTLESKEYTKDKLMKASYETINSLL